MRRLLTLLIPALIPSWRFFKSVEPSQRVQYALLATRVDHATGWQDARPKPPHVSAQTMFHRLFWNPDGNETLYLTSLAERLSTAPSLHSTAEITRILAAQMSPSPQTGFLQFRIAFTYREGAKLIEEISHISKPHEL